MLNAMFNITIIILISNIMMSLALILSKKSFLEREKMTAFECGFDQKSSSRLPFSLRFFLITIIFLIFDIEIALIFPAIINLQNTFFIFWMLLNFVFVVILLIGLFHEWNQGMLEWTFN
uniref:NADH-ubiquinone oxidoreductase chain 3 n=1 Tax=Kaestneriella sp. KaspPE TaxID=2597008 RepID=A0A8K1ZFQ4_9NEOP|nr:NADH dehydrogenase subunit 3 [Kaestneriella sp. KaspPE]